MSARARPDSGISSQRQAHRWWTVCQLSPSGDQTPVSSATAAWRGGRQTPLQITSREPTVSRILFVMLHPGFIRYYEGALHALASAGHHVHVAFEIGRTKLGEDVTAQRLASSSDRITCGTTPGRPESVRNFLARGDRSATRSGDEERPTTARARRQEAWESLATTVRLLLDYLRFFEPAFAGSAALGDRAEKRLPRIYVTIVKLLSTGGARGRQWLASILRGLERVIPVNPALESFIGEQNPDLILVTPLIEFGSQQVDYVKCARRLGIRSALCVASWDNLTSKGLIRVTPDHVVVWNDAQKREAVELHGVAPEQVVITGAQLFDPWFEAKPSRSREDFCRTVGLDPDRPFALYVGSSIFIAPEEVAFAERWIAALRASTDPAVARLGALVRPHPANSRQWRTFDPTAFSNVALWPPIGTEPISPDFRRDYFDSLYYSAAVVGINTSAQLEAGILGRPVFTVCAPEFAHAQAGTLHFQHLVHPKGGLVQVAATLDEHVVQLAATSGGRPAGAVNREFVRWFIRPLGLDIPVAPVFARVIDELRRLPRPIPHGDTWLISAVRPLAFLLARVARALAEDRPLWVYPLRPIVTAAVWTWSLSYRFQDVWRRFARSGVRRMSRSVHRAWYESSQRMRKRVRRGNKRLASVVRRTGVAVKRAARRARVIPAAGGKNA